MDALFTLVRQLARREPVTHVAAPKWLVQRHGLAAMAARAGAASFRDDLVRGTVAWAQIAAEVPQVVSALVDAGVRVVALKGLAFAKSLYQTPAERTMTDVDLLVPPGALERARSTLAKLGFVPAASDLLHHAAPWVRGELVIDLHWNIIAAGRGRIDLDAVWARTRPGWPVGADYLEPVDALVFHLIHLARNRLRLPLMNVVDARRLAESASIESAISRASSWGLGVAAKLASRLCNSILEDRRGLPAGWLGPTREEVALLAEHSAGKKILFDIAIAGSPTQFASRVAHFATNRMRRLMRVQDNAGKD